MKRLLLFLYLVCGMAILTGFNLDNAIVPEEDIFYGGVPKDGIPAILEAKFIEPGKADFLKDDDQVIGVFREDVAKAYPIKILNWHEVVNDAIHGQAFAVTF